MNPIKAAAYIALLVAIAACGYILYQTYMDVILLRSSIDAFGGPNHSQLLEYWLPAGIALVGIIVSLALFGLAKHLEPPAV